MRPGTPAAWRRGAVGALAAFAALITALIAAPPAGADAFDPASLSPADRAILLNILEFERTNVRRELPASGRAVSVTMTETSPRVCRYFVIAAGDGQGLYGVGCRASGGQWDLAGSADDIPVAEALSRAEAPASVAPAAAPPPAAAPSPAPQTAAVPQPARQTPTTPRGVTMPPDIVPPTPPSARQTPAATAPQVAAAPLPLPLPAERAGQTAPAAAAAAPTRAAASAPTMPLPERKPGSAPTAAPDSPPVATATPAAATDIPLPPNKPTSG